MNHDLPDFNSAADVTEAMRRPDPQREGKTLYETTATFRAAVATKLAEAVTAGRDLGLRVMRNGERIL
jgi:hypothetical protein